MFNLTQWENLIRTIVIDTLNVPAARRNDFVRFTWPRTQQPGWPHNLDVCFIMITPEVSEIERWRDQEYNNPSDVLKYTRVISVSFIFYGPNAWENCCEIKDALNYYETTAMLRSNNIALITDSTSPTRVPELFNTNWYNKCTYTANFNELVIKTYTETYIDDPIFELHTDPNLT